MLAPDLFWRMEPGVDLGYTEADFGKAFGYYQRFDANQSIKDSADALKVLRARPECVGKVGALGFCLGGKLAYLVGRAHRGRLRGQLLWRRHRGRHRRGRAGQVPDGAAFRRARQICAARGARTGQRRFRQATRMSRSTSIRAAITPLRRHERTSFNKPAAMMAHSRSIALFRKVLGPHYDLGALWDTHTELRVRRPRRATRPWRRWWPSPTSITCRP